MAAADKIVMASGDWCPYVCNPKLHDGKYGYLPDMAKIVFEKAGHSFEMRYMPFARVVDLGKKGKIDGIPGVYKGDVPSFVFPPVPQGIGINTFYVEKGSSWKFENLDSLQKLTKLGLIRDYYYGDDIKKFVETFPAKVDMLHGGNPQKRSLMKLKIGRVGAWLEDNQVAQYNIKRLELKKEVKPAGHTKEQFPVYIAFSPKIAKSGEYVRIVTEGVEKLRQSGDLKKILSVYGIDDWKKQ